MGQPSADVLHSARLVARRRVVRRARITRLRRMAVAGTTVVSVAYGGWALAHSRLFALEGVEVAGTVRLDRDRVMEAAGIRLGMNVLSIDPGAIRDRIEALPVVERVDVRRLYPSRLRIEIAERTPAAVVALAESEWLIDARGIAIARAPASEGRGLPLVRLAGEARITAGRSVASVGALEGLKMWHASPADLRRRIESIDVAGPRWIVVRLGDTEVAMGDSSELAAKYRALAQILARAGGRRVTSVDVSAPSRPAARFA